MDKNILELLRLLNNFGLGNFPSQMGNNFQQQNTFNRATIQNYPAEAFNYNSQNPTENSLLPLIMSLLNKTGLQDNQKKEPTQPASPSDEVLL